MSASIGQLAVILGDTIRDLRGVPSGDLYAHVMGHMDVYTYDAIIEVLVKTKLVSRKNHYLTWIGPVDGPEDRMKHKSQPARVSTPTSEHSRARRKANAASSTPPSTSEQNAAPTAGVVSLASPDGNGSTSEGAAVPNGTFLPQGQNIALPSPGSALSSVAVNSGVVVNSSVAAGTVNPVTVSKGQNTMATLRYRKTDKSGSSSYSIEGVKSSVYFNKGMFAGEPPATLEIELPDGFAFTEPGAKAAPVAVKETPEQKAARLADAKAKRAAMTPAEKAAERLENARKALEAAQKAAAKVAQPVAV